MANIKSQKKRIRTNEKSRVRNAAVRSALKTSVRRVDQALATGNKEAAQAALRRASRAFDVATSKGIIHANNAANRKSALARRVNAAG